MSEVQMQDDSFEFIPRGVKKISDDKYKVRVMVNGARKTKVCGDLKSAIQQLNEFRGHAFFDEKNAKGTS